MYRDNTLIPTETVRLAALGALADQDMRYAEVAADVRHFTQRIVGPSLDLVGTPTELLIVEGLVDAVDGQGMEDNALLRITDSGWDEFKRLMTSAVRAPMNDMSKLILALKMRFLHLLPQDAREEQLDQMVETIQRELARLTDLRATYEGEPGYFLEWLEQDIEATRKRLEWFEAVRDRS
jgi:DNA-binding PadR family transcriptional regulator